MINLFALATCCLVAGTACEENAQNCRLDDASQSGTTSSAQEALLTARAIRWNFATTYGWELANQGEGSGNDFTAIEDNAECTDGKALCIRTQAGSRQRQKIRTTLQYGAGRYTWRAFISDLNPAQRVSIGSWLWHDDGHELDFEVGSGTAAERTAMQAGDDGVLAYATCQANPWVQQKTKIRKNSWHTFQIDMQVVEGKYLATWLIDGVVCVTQQLAFGQEIPFHIYCSLENLVFIGDAWPDKDNYGLWDYVTYTPYTYSCEPRLMADPPKTPTDE